MSAASPQPRGERVCALVALAAGLLTAATWPPPARAATAEEKPNLILILADDLGYGDLGIYGNAVIRTPHIDALARRGVRFTAGYVSAAVCSPSRAGIVTGRYQQRFGYEFNDNHEPGLPAAEETLGELLHEAGYATGYVGKWHLGWAPEQRPQRRGFDEFFGMEDSGSLYISPDAPDVESWTFGPPLPKRRTKPIYRGDQPVEEPEYLTDAWTREALAFLERHRREPFFLVVAYNAPHTPFQATAEHLAPYSDLPEGPARIYAAMVSALDAGVGAIASWLRDNDLEDQTLVAFLSDNGCASYLGPACSNAPFAGGKRSQQEGGIRVPLILSWPQKLEGDRLFHEPVISLDIAPTFLAAAGAELPPELDGVDLLPHLSGERRGTPHERLYWRAGPNRAIRQGDLKLWQVNRASEAFYANWSSRGSRPRGWTAPTGSPWGQLTVLYDLASDPGEKADLSRQRPDTIERLRSELEAWEAGLSRPSLRSRRASAIRVEGTPVQLIF